jgi:general stress protein YciG
MSPQESGRRGGLATRDNHITLCPCCGNPIESEFYRENGRAGGQVTLERYGREHFAEMGKLGGRGNTKERRMLCQS